MGREVTLFAVALGVIPYYLESRKDLVPKDKQQEPFRPFPFISSDEY